MAIGTGSRGGKGRPAGRLPAWPRVGIQGLEAVKWQVWIGYQLREWRLHAGLNSGEMKQETAARLSGLRPTFLTALELGRQGPDVAELRELATLYKRSTTGIGELFVPPSTLEWDIVRKRFQADLTFRKPPTEKPIQPKVKRR